MKLLAAVQMTSGADKATEPNRQHETDECWEHNLVDDIETELGGRIACRIDTGRSEIPGTGVGIATEAKKHQERESKEDPKRVLRYLRKAPNQSPVALATDGNST